MRPTSAASAKTRRSRTVSASGWSATICARAQLSTPCKSPSCSGVSICRRPRRDALRHVAPVAQQVLLDELEPAVILAVHLPAFERGNLVELEQHVAPERVLDLALDEGDGNEPFAASDRQDLMEGVRRIDDRFARLQLE